MERRVRPRTKPRNERKSPTSKDDGARDSENALARSRVNRDIEGVDDILEEKWNLDVEDLREDFVLPPVLQATDATRRTLPPMRSPSASSTLVFVPQSSLGQRFGTSFLMISQSFRLCSFSETLGVTVDTSRAAASRSAARSCAPSGPECCCVAFPADASKLRLSSSSRAFGLEGGGGGGGEGGPARSE